MFILFAPSPDPSPTLSPREIIKLVGFATGAALHLYLCWMLFRRYGMRRTERVLLSLGLSLGLWHLGNFVVAIYESLGMVLAGWWRKGANVVAYTALAFLPPLLAHAHFKLWQMFDERAPRRWLKPLAWLGYLPLLSLPWVVVKLWQEPYQAPIDRLAVLLLPFMLWFILIFLECAALDWRLARIWQAPRERQFFRVFGATMAAAALLFLFTYVFGARHWKGVGDYLDLFARLSSVIPTAIVAYYIYRYRYFELVLRQSFVYAVVAAVVMMSYIYGIRRLSLILQARYDVRPEVVEALLILVLMFLAGPLRRVTDTYLRQLFTREVGLYRELVAQVGAAASNLGELAHFIEFVERRLQETLELEQVQVIPSQLAQGEAQQLCRLAEERQLTQLEDAQLLERLDALACYALWREGRVVGLLIVRSRELTVEKREVLTVLAGHIAVALENCQLLEEKVKLERQLAERERLASLGQMAATVAHEVKNPLSAIKSIAQVMREDEAVSREYGRDLELITGEVDRLNRSVSQLLSFSRPAVVAASSASLREICDAVLALTRTEAAERAVQLGCALQTNPEFNGDAAAALKEVLLNLVLNALQASKVSEVQITSELSEGRLRLSVSDEGAGVPAALQEKVFEPFFTTKQRGTGLGLAIVARRVRELGGSITLKSPLVEGRGARFELVLPVTQEVQTISAVVK